MKFNVLSEGLSENENVALMSCHDTGKSQKEPTLWMILEIFDAAHITIKRYMYLPQYSFYSLDLYDSTNTGNFM